MEKFNYLGAIITDRNEVSVDIRSKITAGNRCYYALYTFLTSREITRKVKLDIYTTVIRPVLLYGAETWVLTERDENVLNVWERKVLRKIYGPVCRGGEWRIRTNHEIQEMYGRADIVTEIKMRRLSWLGHMERMSEERGVKKVYRGVPGGRRLRGRPRKRWSDDVEEDLLRMGVRTWRRKAINREEWNGIIQEARALHGL